MNWLDVVLSGVILLFVIRGVLKGLFREGVGLAGVLVGLILAVNRYQELGRMIQGELNFFSLKVANMIAFVIIFGGIAILGAIAGVVIHNILSHYSLTRGVEEGGGFILGLIEGALICSIILVLISVSPFSGKFSAWSKGSILKPYLLRVGPFVYDGIVSLVPGEAKKFIEKLDPSNLQQSMFKIKY